MTNEERDKLAKIEQELRAIAKKLDSDDIGEIADQISMLVIPIEVKR